MFRCFAVCSIELIEPDSSFFHKLPLLDASTSVSSIDQNPSETAAMRQHRLRKLGIIGGYVYRTKIFAWVHLLALALQLIICVLLVGQAEGVTGYIMAHSNSIA